MSPKSYQLRVIAPPNNVSLQYVQTSGTDLCPQVFSEGLVCKSGHKGLMTHAYICLSSKTVTKIGGAAALNDSVSANEKCDQETQITCVRK